MFVRSLNRQVGWWQFFLIEKPIYNYILFTKSFVRVEALLLLKKALIHKETGKDISAISTPFNLIINTKKCYENEY